MLRYQNRTVMLTTTLMASHHLPPAALDCKTEDEELPLTILQIVFFRCFLPVQRKAADLSEASVTSREPDRRSGGDPPYVSKPRQPKTPLHGVLGWS